MCLVTGLRKPRETMILGSDIAGQAEAVGVNATRFRPGDDVFAEVGSGGCAECLCVPESKLALKPAAVTHEQAAQTALIGLRDLGRVQPGRRS